MRRARRPPAPWRDERGFTLVELLAGMSIGLLIVLAAFLILDRSTSLSKRTYQRVDATQRGRLAMDLVMRELRSQVCLSNTQPPITEGTDSAVTFYVNLGGPDTAPERHRISLEGGTIVLRRYVGSGTPPTMTWPSTPTSTRTILENVTTLAGTPFLRYYGWGTGTPLLPDAQLATPLAGENLGRTVKVAAAFRANPAADFRNAEGSAVLQDSVFVRSADPLDPTRGPRCN